MQGECAAVTTLVITIRTTVPYPACIKIICSLGNGFAEKLVKKKVS